MTSPGEFPASVLAGVLLVGGIVAAGPASAALARASWARRAPGPALILWQSLCLCAGLCLVGSGVLLAVHPWGSNIFGALSVGWQQFWAGHWFRGLEQLNIVAGLIAMAFALYLLVVLVITTTQTLRRRRRHRLTLDLISRRRPGFDVVDSDRPVAYSLPGLKSRVVLSEGLLATLGESEARAVIEHERAHLRARHDLLLLPFGAWARGLGWVPGVRHSRLAVADLAEMHADDVAVRRVDPAVLAGALAAVVMAGGAGPDAMHPQDGSAVSQSGGSAVNQSGGTTVEPTVGAIAVRVRRLIEPRPLSASGVLGIQVLAFALLAVPTAVLLIGWR